MATVTTLSLSYSALLLLLTLSAESKAFSIKEATITGINHAFKHNQLTSRQLVEFYLKEIQKLNPILNAVIEVNPDALRQADKADQERKSGSSKTKNGLHGIPVLLKDNIATKDKLNTTAGSFALLGSIVPRDAGVARKLRIAGAIILGKASLSEWSAFRSSNVPNGWNARAGQSKNPYVLSVTPCGSSSGSAITVATNMVTVAVGSETDGSIICPSTLNSVVGIKPTVGLTSRAGVVPISPRQDTIGPIARTVADAVYVLDAIVGYDKGDAKATSLASKFIPAGGYKAFLKADGLKGKRLGIVRSPFFTSLNGTLELQVFNRHFKTLRKNGAIVVDNLEIANLSTVVDWNLSGENTAMLAEFKQALNAYLRDLVRTPVRTLKDIIVFNSANKKEMVSEFGQDIMVDAEKTNGIGHKEKEALLNMNKLSKNGLEKLVGDHKLDAIVTPDYGATSVFAIGGYPAITVPAGYRQGGVPFGIYFGGLRGSEPKLIEIAYAFEQATKIRRPPSFRP